MYNYIVIVQPKLLHQPPAPTPALVHKLTEWKGACPLLATACTTCKALTVDTCQVKHSFYTFLGPTARVYLLSSVRLPKLD